MMSLAMFPLCHSSHKPISDVLGAALCLALPVGNGQSLKDLSGVLVAPFAQSVEHSTDTHGVHRLGHGLVKIGRRQRIKITVQKTGGLDLDEPIALASSGLCAILACHLGTQV
ncbi:MAG TPA: hypothetical protein PLR85_18845 [Nitrospira sp.]|nr:hypothetical protein [Nitrospira sp.]HNA86887.1 hypothetical protein [Nitrospira sp.]HNG04465.1 hypothetical protein [Nitrospira sp.]HNG55450.1 hypothetical protein [Nitrospira sp.]